MGPATEAGGQRGLDLLLCHSDRHFLFASVIYLFSPEQAPCESVSSQVTNVSLSLS